MLKKYYPLLIVLIPLCVGILSFGSIFLLGYMSGLSLREIFLPQTSFVEIINSILFGIISLSIYGGIMFFPCGIAIHKSRFQLKEGQKVLPTIVIILSIIFFGISCIPLFAGIIGVTM